MVGESVVLVDEENRVLGTMPKAEVHRAVTPLHRGFSCFVFRASDRQLLLQQRSGSKATWPLTWSNSCCGHPDLTETAVQAARRRLHYELGLEASTLIEAAPYRYCFSKDGVMENEICPIVVGIVEHEPIVRPDEVAATAWTPWPAFLAEIGDNPRRFSEWCIEEARILTTVAVARQVIGV